MLYSTILIILAAAMNQVMDKLDHHFGKSVFKNWKKSFWKKSVSSIRKYELPWWVPDAVSDGWHIAKTIMIFLLMWSIVMYNHENYYTEWWHHLINFALLGTSWNCSFSLMGALLLTKKKETSD